MSTAQEKADSISPLANPIKRIDLLETIVKLLAAAGNSLSVPTINAQAGNYTLALTDGMDIISMDNAVLTVPLNASVPFPIGTVIYVLVEANDGLTVRGATGVTLNGTAEAGGNESDVTSSGAWSEMKLVKVALNEWQVVVVATEIDGGTL